MNLRKSIRPYIGIILTTIFLGLIIYAVDLEASVNALKSADPFFLGLALISANLPLLVYSFTWRKILSITGLQLSYFNTFRLVLANTFINNITPFGNIGGEAAATYILAKISDMSYGKSFTAVFTASIINFSPMLTFLIFGGLYTGFYQILTIPILAFVIYILFRDSDISVPLPESLDKFKQDFTEAKEIIKNSDGKIWPLIILTHFAVVFDVLSIVLIGLSLGFELYSASIFLVVPLARVANYVPTPGGTGPYELALSGLLSYFFLLTFADGVLVAVIYRAITYYTGTLIGYFSFNSFQLAKSYLTE